MFSKIGQMKNRMLTKKLNILVVLMCALSVAFIYAKDLKYDYYFYFKGKKSIAIVEQIEKVKEYRPYIVKLGYYNENTKKAESCSLKLDGNFGSTLTQGSSLYIFYTEQNPCDLYIEGYKYPTKMDLVIHVIIFSIAIFACIVFSKKILFNQKMD